MDTRERFQVALADLCVSSLPLSAGSIPMGRTSTYYHTKDLPPVTLQPPTAIELYPMHIATSVLYVALKHPQTSPQAQ